MLERVSGSTLGPVAGGRDERLAENEALFRAANERMAEWEERHEGAEAESYFCECARPECLEKVKLRREDYESVRSNPARFFIVPGHEIPEIESVVDSHDDWLVIEKAPETRHVVEATDPRRDPANGHPDAPPG
jgi:hypothetical protein